MFLIKNVIAIQLLFHVLCNCFKIPIKFCIRMVQMLLFGMTWYLEINFSYIYVRQKVLAESIEIPFKCIEWNAYTIDVSVVFSEGHQIKRQSFQFVLQLLEMFIERQIDFSVSLHLHPLAGIWIKFFTWEISVASSTLNRCSSRKCKGQTSYQITSSKTNRQTNFVFCEIGSFFGWWFTASHLSETYFWGRRFSQSLRWIFETN